MADGNKILALVKYDRKGASSRVRFWNLVPHLENYGWEVDVVPMLGSAVLEKLYQSNRRSYGIVLLKILSRGMLLMRADPTTLLWVEKELLYGVPRLVEIMFDSLLKRCVIDYDDAVFLNYNDSALGVGGRRAKFNNYAVKARCITVGSDYLVDEFRGYGAGRIRKIPSTVSVAGYAVRAHAARRVTVIGWIGTPFTVKFLDGLRDVLSELSRRVPIQLTVVGATWKGLGVDTVCMNWSESSEAGIVSSFDVGIMPLIDGPWERAKCGYKLVQYMAAGIVPVGAKVGENRSIIQEGVNGFLAGDASEWLIKLEMLCRNVQLRREVGARARRTALERYDISRAAQAVHEVFGELRGLGRRGVKK